MKRITCIALLTLLPLAVRATSLAQASPAETVDTTVRMTFAWDRELLPLNDRDLGELADRVAETLGDPASYSAVVPSGLPDADEPAGATASKWTVRCERFVPADRPRGTRDGWDFARLSVSFRQSIQAGRPGMARAESDRQKLLAIVSRSVQMWLAETDRLTGRTQRTHDDLKAEFSRLGQWRSQNGVTERLREISRETWEIQVDVAAKEARLKAMEGSIADLRRRAAEQAAQDPVLKDLQAIADLREEATKLARDQLAEETRGGRSSVVEAGARLRDAQVKALEAKVQVAHRREAVAATVGGDLLSKLTNEVAMLSIDLAEMKARGETLREGEAWLEKKNEDTEGRIRRLAAEMSGLRSWQVVSEPEVAVGARRPQAPQPTTSSASGQ